MIDCHCHLEQPDYNLDRDKVIEKCKKELNAVVTSCAHPNDFELTMQLVEKYKGFVFATVGIHPEYIKEVKEKDVENFLELIKLNKDKIVGIGEIGLDYNWVKESDWQEKQKELFVRLISFAKELKLPVVIHSRDASEDSIKILEQEDAKQVVMHMFGFPNLLKRVVDNDWYVSLNTIIMKSKKHKKIVRDIAVQLLLTETDSPWLGLNNQRNDPIAVKSVIERIAEIKKMKFEEVDRITTENAIRFFRLHEV